MKTIAIIQARMGSSRLPGKVLLDIAGKPMIQHVIERTQRARSLDSVTIATTTDPADDPVAAFALSMGVPCTRGSLHDVLDRYYQAAKTYSADTIVRITADCPLIGPQVIDQTVELLSSSFISHPSDFSCNRLPPPFSRTFPIGLDVEVCTFSALERAWKESTKTFHREHVMPFLYENTIFEGNPQSVIPNSYFVLRGFSQRNFKIAQLHHSPRHGDLRWTVDTPEDLSFMREIFARLGDKPGFTWYDVLEIVQKEPQLAEINAAVRHKTMTEVDERQQ
ncbi:MAG: glycosyltransferase family protein [Anaerolineae bacterium]|nr:glycosyltransferase family protein [Anaerolineae bacterium]